MEKRWRRHKMMHGWMDGWTFGVENDDEMEEILDAKRKMVL